MKAEDVKKILDTTNNKSKKVVITSNSGKEYKMRLRINPMGMLCIGNENSKSVNYIIGDSVTENWKDVRLC